MARIKRPTFYSWYKDLTNKINDLKKLYRTIDVEELIKADYKALSKKYHPDLWETKEQFQELRVAKEKLVKAI